MHSPRSTNLRQTGGDDIELQISKACIQTLEYLVHSKDNEIAQLRKVIEQLKLGPITKSNGISSIGFQR